MDRSKVLNSIFLTLFTIAGCIFGASMVMISMFMVTDDFTWFYMTPLGIVLINLFSISTYRWVLVGGWRYLYNVSVTVLVTVICGFGSIEWVESIHGAKGTLSLRLAALLGVLLSIAGIVISLKISRKRRDSI